MVQVQTKFLASLRTERRSCCEQVRLRDEVELSLTAKTRCPASSLPREAAQAAIPRRCRAQTGEVEESVAAHRVSRPVISSTRLTRADRGEIDM